ncbi:hypothetical protein ACTZWT_23210 [Rhodopseudomonas sp. NSM]|uniref:hypothetical protein n=1 Tax=Rhodopseudomonas sp. NSM TaxID=3457630 RepID=UPI0040353110
MGDNNQAWMPNRKGVLQLTAASSYLRKNWHLNYSAAALTQLAATGEGPRFYIYNGKMLYPLAELDAFAEAKLGPLLSQSAPALQAVASTKKVDAAADRASRRAKWRKR